MILQVTGPVTPDCFMWPYTCDPMQLVWSFGAALTIALVGSIIARKTNKVENE